MSFSSTAGQDSRVTLNQLFAEFLSEHRGDLIPADLKTEAMDREVTGIVFDSRRLKAGSVFVAIRGEKRDGHDYLVEAVRSGAIALVVEAIDQVPSGFNGLVVKTQSTRKALGQLAARLKDRPSESLKVVCVTGTNGKTTITHMLEAVLNGAGWPTGVIGTIDHHLGSYVWPTDMTTPDPLTFQARLGEFLAAGAKAVALEASSHALEQARIDGVEIDVAIFSNLTRDHLDYHQTMEQYFASKAKLFTELLAQSKKPKLTAVIHADDPWGERLVRMLRSSGTKARVDVTTFGRHSGADYTYEVLDQNFTGARFRIRREKPTNGGDDSAEFLIQMPGLHNVQNAVSAILSARAFGIHDDVIGQSLAELSGVPGRLERVGNDRGIHIFVDYAHTDDALQSILRTLDSIRKSSAPFGGIRLLTVFGCGGDRDRGKRPMMARAALDQSDVVVVTSDNPRSEDPEAIIDDIVSGARNDERDKLIRCVDRRAAIKMAIIEARRGDVVLIAGKGHERTQTIGADVFDFSDAIVAGEVLVDLRGDA